MSADVWVCIARDKQTFTKKEQSFPHSAEFLFGGIMPVKIKIVHTRPQRVTVDIRVPEWREYIQY